MDNDLQVTPHIHDLEVGVLVGLSDDGTPLVTFASNPLAAAAIARATLDLQSGDVGCSVALLFEKGDPCKPVVIGRMRRDGQSKGAPASTVQADIDGKLVTIVAKERLRLVCGKASITLESDGSIDITGVHIENRASGQNKIKGASIALN